MTTNNEKNFPRKMNYFQESRGEDNNRGIEIQTMKMMKEIRRVFYIDDCEVTFFSNCAREDDDCIINIVLYRILKLPNTDMA